MTGLRGEALVREGLADFQSGRCTIPACLMGIARSRLHRAGLIAGVVAHSFPEPERQLYRLLRQPGRRTWRTLTPGRAHLHRAHLLSAFPISAFRLMVSSLVVLQDFSL